jgi:hyperosmotically inducible periplasmic protein
MKKTHMLIACLLAATLGYTAPVSAKESRESGKDPAPSADNTKMNKQHSKEMTADQQGQSKADLKLTQDIRKAIIKDKSLSQYAHNVKIITRDGAVTLKGPVRSEKEKKAVEKAAVAVAGKGKITNELEIAPENAK